MRSFLDKIFSRSNNLGHINDRIKNFSKNSPVNKIFEIINSFSTESEIRYVGGCVRKLINNEKTDDIDLATNLEPNQICEILKKNKISFYESGIKYGTITALIDKSQFEITSLRSDISTDGRHAEVKFSKSWKEDSLRRDFTINSIYSDRDGNLFDPNDGKKDLKNGVVRFIGEPDKRIKEDYLRILRYLRFFLNYSKHNHNLDTLKKLKMNIGGISKLSKERLFDELKKILKLKTLEKLSKDKISKELVLMIFPELKNLNIFAKLDQDQKAILEDVDFIFLLSLIIIDGTDNVDYFIYKFNISKKDEKRIKNINNFYLEKITSKTFSERNINKIFYYLGKEATMDILNFRIIKSKKLDKSLLELIKLFQNKPTPVMPIGANELITKYKIPEGKQLGVKLKLIEEEWAGNNFKISDQQIDNIIKD